MWQLWPRHTLTRAAAVRAHSEISSRPNYKFVKGNLLSADLIKCVLSPAHA